MTSGPFVHGRQAVHPPRPATGRVAQFSGAWCRGLLLRALSGVREGQVTVRDALGTATFGDGEPAVTISVRDVDCYRRLVVGGSIGAGESYADGLWEVDDLTSLVRIMVRNEAALGALDGPLQWLRGIMARISRLAPHNALGRSRRDIGYHYDLSNEFFATFLCRRMMYSAALFETDRTDIEEASAAKIDRVLDKLALSPAHHLLEVGSGWGSLAIRAAQRHGCRVTTTTISEAQFRHVGELVARAGLEDRVCVLNRDYRELTGRFDRIVSVEMVEAVGHRHLDGYFAKLGTLLKDDGLMALQAITIRDSHYLAAVRSTDFIKKHIFPGSFIPSVSRLVDAAAANSATVLVHLEDLGYDYALTLRHWRQRCEDQATAIDRLGFDERFRRLWRFYLAYCEGAFLERRLSDVQILFTGAGWRGRAWRGGPSGRA